MGIGFSGAGVEHQEELMAVRPKHDVVKNGELWIDGIDEDGDEIVEIDVENMEGEAGKRVVKKILDPMLPSRAEVREHDLTHLPYRNWCPHCIKGKGKEMGHQRRSRDDQGLAEYHLDYCFPGDDMGFKVMILIGIEKYSGMKMAQVVPTKGSSGEFAARKVAELIEECGDKNNDIILRTDQEPAS